MALLQQRMPYTETIVIEDDPPTTRAKRIKLTHKKSELVHSILDFTNLLDTASNSTESLQILMQISDCMQFDESEMLDGIKKLCDHFRKDQSVVRVKILSLLGDFATELNVDGNFLAEEILNLLKSDDSANAKVLCSAFSVLHKIGASQSLPPATLNKLVEFAKSKLTSHRYNVQRHAILLIGAFASIQEAEAELLDLVSRYTDSQDARVRAQAFGTILKMGERGVKLDPTLYPRAEKALKDDYECVRREALQLIYEIGTKHAEHLIPIPDSEQELRLIDDAFGKVCSAISDISMQIRQLAAGLLGGMSNVNTEFLHQTLDKKLMSNMRRKKSLHERALENFTSGEWSSGKKWADDAPKELLHSDTISLIDSGSCGALVQGLEDEFLEVRLSSVRSICRLSLINPPFACYSLDFLIDMFNDEIESVRLETIHSLTRISNHIMLREDQLEIMLSSLEDYSVEVREGLHLMLGACKVSTKACLILVIQKVLDVLSKYPTDKLSAYGCLQRVGQKHPELCMSLTTQLLQDHPFFDSAERDVEDPTYVCILIMLFNAAQHLTPMLSLFPDTTIKHYAYLRDTMPNFVPPLPIGFSSHETSLVGSTGSRQFLETLLANIQTTYSAPKARQALLQAAQENLERLATIHPQLSGTAYFTSDFLGTQLNIEMLQSSITSNQNRPPSRESLNQLIKKCLKLQNLFSNLTKADLSLVKQISLRACALNLILIVKDKSQSALAPCQLLMHVASNATTFFQENPDIVPDSFTSSILSHLASVNDPKPGKVYREILPIIQGATPMMTPQINVNIKMCTAKIIEPNEQSSIENVVKVTAGLIAALPIVAEIENLQDFQTGDIRIKIKYPDQNQNVVIPRLRDLKKMLNESGEEMEHNWKLRTQVLLSHGIWTEASQVEISICLSVKPANSELELCKPIKILFAPKPIKRGI